MNREKIDERIKNNLFSAKSEVVLSAIEWVKTKGNKLYIPLLFDLLNSSPGHEIETEIKNLLETIKDKNAVNIFMRAIEDEKYKGIRKTILAACWQNGLDFSTFLPVFVDLVIHEDWKTAFEAFTVIDNFEFFPGEEIINVSIHKINEAMPTVPEQYKYLLNEILLKLK